MARRVVLLVLALTLAAVAAAAVYTWVDERGVTHYSETPPQGRRADEVKVPAPPQRGDVEKVQPAPATASSRPWYFDFVGTWQFPGYMVWVHIAADGSALQCRIGGETVFASRGRVLAPDSVVWSQAMWEANRLSRDGRDLVVASRRETLVFVPAQAPMDARCGTPEALRQGERDMDASRR
jgi:hypothetical protein